MVLGPGRNRSASEVAPTTVQLTKSVSLMMLCGGLLCGPPNVRQRLWFVVLLKTQDLRHFFSLLSEVPDGAINAIESVLTARNAAETVGYLI
jgi:hypothetical protein